LELITETKHSLIYKVWHRNRQAKLVVKLVKADGRSPESIADECSIMRHMSKYLFPNLLDAFPFHEYHALVMPLALGGDLYSYREENSSLTELFVCQVIYDVARALDHLHSMGYRHGNVRPENLLLLDNCPDTPVTILTGLGNARAFAKDERSNRPLEKSIYAAPEIHSNNSCIFIFLTHR
jgi:serine/threonine protein kinase